MTGYEFESSGKLKMPTEAELAEADKKSAVIAFTEGALADGSPYYAYMAIPLSKYQQFYAATAARETIILSNYGTLIRGGLQAKAPADVIREMREVYGFDDQYEERLKQQMLKEQKEFLTKQENQRIGDIVSMLKKQPKV